MNFTGSVLVNTMKELILHGVFPELLFLCNIYFLTGLVGVLSSVVSLGSFGIGIMLIEYLYYEFGLSVLVRCRGCVGGKVGTLSRAVLCSALLGVSKNVLVGLTI